MASLPFSSFFNRKFNLLNDEAKQLLLAPREPQLIPDIPDAIDGDNYDAVLQFFSQHHTQHTQAFTSQERVCSNNLSK